MDKDTAKTIAALLTELAKHPEVLAALKAGAKDAAIIWGH